jgi:ABC-type bacteriocin/lantibiotic exporter with double-glycine peptidase domain
MQIFYILKKIDIKNFIYFLIFLITTLSFIEYFFLFLFYNLISFLTDPINVKDFLIQKILFLNTPFSKDYLNDIINLKFLINVTIVIFLIKILLTILNNFYLSRVIYLINFRINQKIISNILAKNKNIFNKHSSSYKSLLINEVNIFTGAYLQPLLYFLSDLLIFLSIIFFLASKSFILFLSLLVFTPIIIFASFFYLKNYLFQIGSQREHSSRLFLQYLEDIFSGYQEIKTYKVENYFKLKIEKVMKLLRLSQEKNSFLLTLPKLIIEILIFLFFFLLLFFSNSTQIEILQLFPLITIFVLAAFRLIPILNRTIVNFQQIQYAKSSMFSVSREININIKNHDKIKSLDVKLKKIEVKDLSFFFEKNKILHKINMNFTQGKIYAISGVSGVGKTTLAKLLINFTKPTSGTILINGKKVDLNKLTWLNKSAIVPQDIFLFDDSISENIAFGKINLNSKSKYIDLIKENLIKINKDPKYILGERGNKISGGQKQRLGILRALYHDRDLLIFDESTSSIDNKSQIKILSMINSLRKDKIIILISHDKKVLDFSDKIYYLNNEKN